jgi:nucleoside-diphosphate-sugar epimerase
MTKRIVILGSSGFLGSRIAGQFDARTVVPLTRKDIDLCADDAAQLLALRLRPTDTLIIAAAELPCRNEASLIANTWITATLCEALARQPVDYVINISSDAVYGPIEGPITEHSPTRPTSLLGAMHLSREAARHLRAELVPRRRACWQGDSTPWRWLRVARSPLCGRRRHVDLLPNSAVRTIRASPWSSQHRYGRHEEFRCDSGGNCGSLR